MRRSIENGLAFLSLSACVLASVMFVRSYFRLDDLSHTGRWHVHNFTSQRGRLFIQIGWSTQEELKRNGASDLPGGFTLETTAAEGTPAVESRSRGWSLGSFDCFRWQTKRLKELRKPAAGETVFIFPWWFVVVATAALPVARGIELYRSRRQAGRVGFPVGQVSKDSGIH